jgi:hypothetical protein
MFDSARTLTSQDSALTQSTQQEIGGEDADLNQRKRSGAVRWWGEEESRLIWTAEEKSRLKVQRSVVLCCAVIFYRALRPFGPSGAPALRCALPCIAPARHVLSGQGSGLRAQCDSVVKRQTAMGGWHVPSAIASAVPP